TAPPSISTQPASKQAVVGASVSFSVVASGSGPFSYQWRKNGQNIANATGSSYSIAAVAAGDAGSYDVVVTGGCGASVTSTAAVLSVFDMSLQDDTRSDMLLINSATGAYFYQRCGAGGLTLSGTGTG